MATYDVVLDALGDGTRRTILQELGRGPAAVADLAGAVPVSRPAVSQHLKVLLGAELVRFDRAGTRNLYRLDASGLEVLRAWADELWSTALGSFETFAAQRFDEEEGSR